MGQIIVVQPAIPAYRIGFFERLADLLGPSFKVYASPGQLGVLTDRSAGYSWEHTLGSMRAVLPGLVWQDGAFSVPISRGDTLVISGEPRRLSNIALLLKAKMLGVRTIWWGHYWSATSRPWRAGLRMILMRLADAVLFYTDQEVAEYRAGRANHRKVVMALNNGIDTGDIALLRKPYDPATRPRDLLFIGRLTKKSNLELLIEALASPHCGGTTLDVIGSGNADDEASMRSWATELGVAARVKWHGGTTDEARIAEIANSCKAFVYPGGVGLSLIHAFAYGLPAIVHGDRWRQMPEFAALREGENGMTFRFDDASSLADAVTRMLSNPTELEQMSAEAIKRTTETFNSTDMASRFCKLIAELSP